MHRTAESESTGRRRKEKIPGQVEIEKEVAYFIDRSCLC